MGAGHPIDVWAKPLSCRYGTPRIDPVSLLRPQRAIQLLPETKHEPSMYVTSNVAPKTSGEEREKKKKEDFLTTCTPIATYNAKPCISLPS
jgi:hypothetical protein